MPRAPKFCAKFGCDALVYSGYCEEHDVRPPSPSSLAGRDRKEQLRRKKVVNEWVRIRGWVCPGYERPEHPSRDLTAAHVVAVAHGGTELRGVLCRSCNSRQNAKPM